MIFNLVFVSVLIAVQNVNGQRGSFLGSVKEPLCVKIDNYCELNADCCSKLCLGSTHRCIAAGISGIANNSTQPASSNLLNRFGEEEKPCSQIGNSCLLGRDCCSGKCSSNTQKCFDQTSSAGVQGQNELCAKVNQQCSTRSCCSFLSCEKGICHDMAVEIEGTETFGFKPSNNTLDNRFGEGEIVNQTQSAVAPSNVKCAEIGSKCYKESECCKGLRCHGFLHQCVT